MDFCNSPTIESHATKLALKSIYGAFHAKSDGFKNFNFWFPSFFDIFLVSIKKTLPGIFEIFLITGLKDIEFRFFAHNFFKNGPNLKFYFLKFLFFYIFFFESDFFFFFLSFKILVLFLKLYVGTLRFFW